MHKMLTKINKFGVWLSDEMSEFCGSWTFILSFIFLMVLWILINTYTSFKPDNFPFMFLNLFLSGLAGIQAPIMLMSNNRQAIKDRKQVEKDLDIDIKAYKKILELEKEILEVKSILLK